MPTEFSLHPDHQSAIFQRVAQKLALLLVTVASLGAVITLQTARLEQLQTATPDSAEALKQKEVQTQLQLRALGKITPKSWRNLTADWAFLQFLQYFGDTTARSRTGFSVVPEFFQIVVKHDPRFLTAYLYLSPSNTLFAGRPELSVELIGKGLQSLSPQIEPESYFLWFYRAADQLLFLGDTPGAKQSYARAAEWAGQVNTPRAQSMAASANQTIQFLERNPTSKRVQASAWAMLLTNSVDPRTQMIAAAKIQALGGQVYLEQKGNVRALRIKLPKE
jgi:hypothetical protein